MMMKRSTTSLKMLLSSLAVLFIVFIGCSDAVFYLPGMAAKDFAVGALIPLKVNKISSVHTQIPYKYYSLESVCKPERIVDDTENLGEILMGDRIENSAYEIPFLEDEGECKVLNYFAKDCNITVGERALKQLQERIEADYKVHWLVDGLPVREYEKSAIDTGFRLGFKEKSGGDSKSTLYYVYNHVDIILMYHQKQGSDTSYIVGFEVEPKSIAYDTSSYDVSNTYLCPKSKGVAQSVSSKSESILWTYSVSFKESKVLWNKRWDVYFETGDSSFHWFSIVNSLMIVFILTIMVAMIMMRALRADFRKYNAIDAEDSEETGWKMIHGDIFRPPARPMFLSVLIGSGVQVFFMTVVTMVFAVLGFLSPAAIGSLATALIVLFVFMAMFAGYFSTRAFMFFKGKNWKKNTLYTAFAFPGIVFGVFFIINMFLRGSGSSAAVGPGSFAAIIGMWFGISVPLVFWGSYFASKKPVPEDPVRTNQIPRQIPDQIWYMNPYLSVLMGGILPFGAVFIELYFILSSLWNNQFYYIFSFLFIVLIILIFTSAEISIVMCYFQLCAEDYHWWWRSFLVSGSSAIYVFFYSISFFGQLQITKFVSVLLYFSYSLIMSLAFFVLTGSIGFFSCYWFVRKIYSSIHIN
ncbi:hypothetical protein CYY_000967 [Polysphondylium violaceum]|uniref:Transmembrane 9 superfamily member n=1 Tax=Polysphondylium violaceum TaxID=133409 RepID=A0A8J4Q1U6_9MYCE|nr:hypothetical protein CYY_000967 [Polysphondylium violaceum]